MLPRRLLAALATLVFTASSGFSEVKWASTEVSLDIDSSQESGTAKFEFVNESQSPMTIGKVAAGCGCTVPTLEKQEYAAGESGSLTAQFSIGERRGVYRIPIHVLFGDGATAELSLVANIRELVTYFPVNLSWAAGEERKPKDIELHWSKADSVEITEIRSINAAFKAELVSDHDWNGARIRVTPAAGKLAGTSVVIIKTAQGADRRSRAYTIVARAT